MKHADLICDKQPVLDAMRKGKDNRRILLMTFLLQIPFSDHFFSPVSPAL